MDEKYILLILGIFFWRYENSFLGSFSKRKEKLYKHFFKGG